jgi:hypothetical protein
MTQFAALHEKAMKAAKEAAQDLYFKRGDNGACGFAWVVVYDVKLSTKMGKEMKAVGFDKNYGGGVSYWNPSRMPVQSVDVLEAGARAYAAVLKNAGYKAYANSRLD